MSNDKFAIWWLSETDCAIIGEPHSYYADIDHWKERRIAPYHNDEGLYWLDFGIMPEYIAKLYSSRYGRAGRGRLWTDLKVCPDSINIPDECFEKSGFTESLENCGGIVILKESIDTIKALRAGVFTDFELNKINVSFEDNDAWGWDYTRKLELHYNQQNVCYMKVVVYTITYDEEPTKIQVKIVDGTAGLPNTFNITGNLGVSEIPVLKAILKKSRIWLNSNADNWQTIANANNIEIVTIGKHSN